MGTPHKGLVVSNHASVTIAGKTRQGTYTQTWITSSQPMDLMSELQKYSEQFPDLGFVEILIVFPDKERNRPIHFGEYPPPRNTG